MLVSSEYRAEFIGTCLQSEATAPKTISIPVSYTSCWLSFSICAALYSLHRFSISVNNNVQFAVSSHQVANVNNIGDFATGW